MTTISNASRSSHTRSASTLVALLSIAAATPAWSQNAEADAYTRYELLVTNRLILEPSLELDWQGEADPERGLGSGLTEAALGLRLRYEIRREAAPYLGLVHERSFGGTADSVRAAGGDPDDTRLVAGIRVWF